MNFLAFISFLIIGSAYTAGDVDINGDGQVNQTDLTYVIEQWRTPGGSPSADFNNDNIVNFTDAGILLSSWGIVPPPPPSTTIRLTADRGIPCDTGANGPDVSQEINAIINTADAGTTIQLDCTYKIDLPVSIENKNDISITGSQGDPSRGFIRYVQNIIPSGWPHGVPFFQYVNVRNSSNVNLSHFTVTGPLQTVTYDETIESAHGVQIAGASTNVIVSYVTVTGVNGDFLVISEHGGSLPNGITIDHMTGDLAGRQMVSPTGTLGVTITNSSFTRSARSAVDVEPSNQLGSFNITIEDSNFLGYTNYGLAGGGAAVPHNNLIVRRTTFKGGRGIAKWQLNTASTIPTHVGFRLEDVTYDWISPEYQANVATGPPGIDAEDVHILRSNMHFRGNTPGSIGRSGEVRDSTFTADNGASVIVCLRGVTASNNIGAEVSPTASCP